MNTFCFLDKFINNYITNAYYIKYNSYKWWVNKCDVIFQLSIFILKIVFEYNSWH